MSVMEIKKYITMIYQLRILRYNVGVLILGLTTIIGSQTSLRYASQRI